MIILSRLVLLHADFEGKKTSTTWSPCPPSPVRWRTQAEKFNIQSVGWWCRPTVSYWLKWAASTCRVSNQPSRFEIAAPSS